MAARATGIQTMRRLNLTGCTLTLRDSGAVCSIFHSLRIHVRCPSEEARSLNVRLPVPRGSAHADLSTQDKCRRSIFTRVKEELCAI